MYTAAEERLPDGFTLAAKPFFDSRFCAKITQYARNSGNLYKIEGD
jgi:hypothetical protein